MLQQTNVINTAEKKTKFINLEGKSTTTTNYFPQ